MNIKINKSLSAVSSMDLIMEEKTIDQVIQEIADTLAQCDGEFIEEIANQVLTRPVKYKGDDWFEQDPAPE